MGTGIISLEQAWKHLPSDWDNPHPPDGKPPKPAHVPGTDEQVVVAQLAGQAGTLDAPPQPGDVLDDGAGVGV